MLYKLLMVKSIIYVKTNIAILALYIQIVKLAHHNMCLIRSKALCMLISLFICMSSHKHGSQNS